MDCFELAGEKPIMPAPPNVWPVDELELLEPKPELLVPELDPPVPPELSVEPDPLEPPEEPELLESEDPKIDPPGELPRLNPELVPPKAEDVPPMEVTPGNPAMPAPPLGPMPAIVEAPPLSG